MNAYWEKVAEESKYETLDTVDKKDQRLYGRIPMRRSTNTISCTHLQSAVDFEATVLRDTGRTCFKCHIDTQTLAGMESANRVPGSHVDRAAPRQRRPRRRAVRHRRHRAAGVPPYVLALNEGEYVVAYEREGRLATRFVTKSVRRRSR